MYGCSSDFVASTGERSGELCRLDKDPDVWNNVMLDSGFDHRLGVRHVVEVSVTRPSGKGSFRLG